MFKNVTKNEKRIKTFKNDTKNESKVCVPVGIPQKTLYKKCLNDVSRLVYALWGSSTLKTFKLSSRVVYTLWGPWTLKHSNWVSRAAHALWGPLTLNVQIAVSMRIKMCYISKIDMIAMIRSNKTLFAPLLRVLASECPARWRFTRLRPRKS